MKVTKQQKLLGGLILAGALLVGADQLGMLPGSPASASEETTQEYALTPPTAPASVAAPAAAPPAPVTATASVAQRLRETAKGMPDNQARDVFALGPSWVAAAPALPQVDLRPLAIEKFKQSHKLTGVLSGKGREHAMINNKIVTIGQSVDGFTLVSVSHRSATFEAEDARVVLNMGTVTAGAQ